MLYAICLVILTILAVNTLYFGVFSAAAFNFRNKRFDHTHDVQTLDMLVVFPVFRSDAVILDSIRRFCAQVYAGRVRIVVIADELQESTIKSLDNMGAVICPLLPSDQRNKARAINTMLDGLKEDFDVCVVMDADNVVEDDFLEMMGQYFLNGALAVQARRVAKNSDNKLAQLDTFSEMINNHIFRKGQSVLGFSSSLIGSGMAFDFALFRNVMRGMDVYSGFDKELELRLLERKVKIEYAEDIIVYDEKVSKQGAFINQKRRWLYAQFFFLKNNFFGAFRHLWKDSNTDFANKVVQFMLLPRLISVGLCTLMLIICPLVDFRLAVGVAIVTMFQFIALVAPLYGKISMSKLGDALLGLPLTFANMIYALVTSGRASKKFLHTPHN